MVKVLKTYEDIIEVNALTGTDALELAEKEAGVIKALEVVYDEEEE